ncbi:fibronectin type III domain-containing protein [Hymenobacter sp. ASUV-10]|uniref:Fibronectin type III domain-containing protein n=1 Tax=Hymenobacter aranciens TaxID=3063996 RepID=A0ABT9BAZ7_9BACT|nr:fibronectin type III domain-containing protein [Hymenobacter sp. ASUV-10]MDO7874808.1 fibronectin type III domain-containing protein [Hymenobacter sp. ASUV-10]
MAQCAPPSNLAVSAITGSSAQLSFTTSSTAQTYTITYTSTGSSGTVTTVTPAPTASPVPLTNLQPLTNYTVTVISNCAGGSSSGVTTSFVTSIANDDPCSATPLSLSGATCQSTAASNSFATTTAANGYDQQGCGGTATPRDVWFTFTTAASGPASTGATISVTGNPAGQIRLFSAASCNGPFTDIACSSNTQPGTRPAPPLTVAGLSPSTTYYVRVASNDAVTTGAFTICVADPPSCGDPNNLTVTPINGTSATVTFRPGFGNTSYVATYTTAAGPGLTVSPAPTGSPFTLNNLQPLTAYTLTLQARCAGGAQGTVLTQTFTTPHPYDEPATARALPLGGSTCTPVAASTQGSTSTVANGYASFGCMPAIGSSDVWFTFTTASTGAASTGATITVGNATPPPAGAAPASEVRVFQAPTGPTGPLTPLACAAGANNAPAPPLVVGQLQPGTTYYVRVRSSSIANTGAFTICVTDPPACPAPQNLTASPVGSTSQLINWGNAGGGGGTFTVEYGPTGFTPGTGQQVGGLTGTSTTLTGLTPGATYQVYVRQICGPTSSSTLVGPVSFTVPLQSNDEPCGAVALGPVGATCTPINASNVGATVTNPNGYQNPGNCGVGGFNPNDVWFTFTTTATGAGSTAATVQVTGNAAGRLRAFSASSCNGPFAAIGCSSGANNNMVAPPMELSQLTPGTTYYVQVSGFGPVDPTGPFTICVSTPPVCATPTTVRVDNISSSAAQLTFTAPAGNTGYTVTYAPIGGGTPVTVTPTPAGSPVALGPLSPSTVYTVTVQAQCAAGQGAPVTVPFTTPGVAPVNDECGGAILLTCGQFVSGNLVSATRTNDPNVRCGNGIMQGAGIFYRIVGTGDSIVVSTCNPGTNYPFEMMVFTGSCSNLQCLTGHRPNIACFPNQAFGNTVGFRTNVGADYYLFISQNNVGPNQRFQLSVQCLASQCPAPSGAAASQLTPTSASISFVAPAGTPPTSYTITAIPGNGSAPVVLQSPASPVALSGLLPGISYTVLVQTRCGSGFSPATATVAFLTPLSSRTAALAAQVELYPNPAHHTATLRLPAALRAAATAALYNGLGQCVRAVPLPATDTPTVLELQHLPAGMYLLRLNTSQGPVLKHLLVE